MNGRFLQLAGVIAIVLPGFLYNLGIEFQQVVHVPSPVMLLLKSLAEGHLPCWSWLL